MTRQVKEHLENFKRHLKDQTLRSAHLPPVLAVKNLSTLLAAPASKVPTVISSVLDSHASSACQNLNLSNHTDLGIQCQTAPIMVSGPCSTHIQTTNSVTRPKIQVPIM